MRLKSRFFTYGDWRGSWNINTSWVQKDFAIFVFLLSLPQLGDN
jgi:hypothetical protein